MMINVMYDDGKLGIGWYVDVILPSNTHTAAFETTKDAAVLEAERLSAVYGHIPIRTF